MSDILKRFFITALAIFLCNAGQQLAAGRQDSKVLAKVGNKEITLKEFLNRCELTVRPNIFKDKKVSLNNLISEKILALEAAKNSELLQNPFFMGKVRGIKEQLMRMELYSMEAVNKVNIDTSEIFNAYKNSIREYELEFYVLNSDSLKTKVQQDLQSDTLNPDNIFSDLETRLGKKPLHKVKYLDPDDEIITEALFNTLLDTGTVIGPLKITNGDHIVMRVANWTDYPVIGIEDQQVRWKKVASKIHTTKSGRMWRNYQADLMRDKRILFERDAFEKVSDIALQHYLKNSRQDSAEVVVTEFPPVDYDVDPNAPFVSINDEVWTVQKFKDEVLAHPLVYRTKNVNEKNFKEQFKLAAVDMIRDYYLTMEAYNKGLDKSEDVIKDLETWKDSYLAIEQQRKTMNTALMNGVVKEDDNSSKLHFWESYVKNLQDKYSKSIKVDYKLFEDVRLTNIDFIAVQPGVPYPTVVPGFPILISSEDLGYIKKETKNK